MTIFLKITGVTGNSTDPNHLGWFEVDAFDFGATRPVSTGSGASTGRVTFSPLTVDINSLVGLAPLLGDAVAGKNLGTVELVETNQAGQNVYDIKLSNATLGSFTNSGGANGIETALTFDFQKVSLTDHGQTSEGGLGPAETANVTAQRFTAGTAAIVQAAPSDNTVHYFLKVQGVTGNSTDAKHQGWFEVDGFDFGVTRPVSTSSGASAGRATFSPLTVDINSLVGLAPLLRDAIIGKNIGTVELVEADQADQNVYDIKLTNASLDKFSNTGGANGIETGLTFAFQKVSLTDHGQTSEGGLGPAETTNATAQRFTAGTAAIVQAAPSENTVHYFLKVQGVTGNSTDAKHQGWFEVDGFDFGVTRPLSIGSSGGAAGQVTFSPLTVDINSLVGLAPLLGDAIIGKNIGTVELVEADQADQNVFDIKLTNASLDKFNNVGGANGIETGLAFAFQKVSLTDHGQTSEGGLGPAETTNATAQRFAAGAALDTVTPSVPSENTVHYFLKVQGVTGNSTAAKHQGWFEVDGFDFGVTRPVSAGSSGGAAGRVTFSPLTVDINSLVGLAPLLRDAIIGKNIGTVELVEADQADQNVYDIKLTNASLDKFSNSGGANGIETGLTFGFQKVSLTDHGQTSEGGLGPAETTNATAQRFAAGTALDTVTQAQNPLHYFLKVEGVTGGSIDDKHAGWFEVDKFDFGVTRPVSIGSSGASAGRVTSSPLTLDINSIVGQAPLLADLASGHALKTVELVGVTQSDQTVYDLKLTNAILSMVQSAAGFPGVETSLAFNFQQGTLIDHGVTTEGALSSPETVNFSSRSAVA